MVKKQKKIILKPITIFPEAKKMVKSKKKIFFCAGMILPKTDHLIGTGYTKVLPGLYNEAKFILFVAERGRK